MVQFNTVVLIHLRLNAKIITGPDYLVLLPILVLQAVKAVKQYTHLTMLGTFCNTQEVQM